jgi:hypothetical protein
VTSLLTALLVGLSIIAPLVLPFIEIYERWESRRWLAARGLEPKAK